MGTPNSPGYRFTTTHLSTSSAEAFKSPGDAREIRRGYNKIVKFMRNRPRGIHYARMHSASYGSLAVQKIMECRIISFSDAGLASLTNSYSVEGNCFILGRAISRGGVANVHGGTIYRICAKIHRGCRSSLGAETHASTNSTDWELRFQIVLIEIFAGVSDVRWLSHPTRFPLWGPFGDGLPTNKSIGKSTYMDQSLGHWWIINCL